MDHLLITKHGALAIAIDCDDEGVAENKAIQRKDDENKGTKAECQKKNKVTSRCGPTDNVQMNGADDEWCG